MKQVKAKIDNDEYLILLNNDTVVDKNFFINLAESIKSKKIESIYGPKIIFDDAKDLIWYGGGKVKLDRGIIEHVGIRKSSSDFSIESNTDYVTGCCMIVRKGIYDDLGGFDESFFMYNEDVDFCLRAKELGLKNWNVSNGALNGDVVNISFGKNILN